MGTLEFVLGLLLGLAVGALAVWAVLRAVGRVAGRRGLAHLVLDGLRPGPGRSGIAAQRALARRLRRTGERTASGRRVAASEVELHVSPEEFARIDEALGIERATGDLLEYYRGFTSRSGWLVQGEPRIELVRDISLRPRQGFARAVVRAEDADRRPRTGAVPVPRRDAGPVPPPGRADPPDTVGPASSEAVTDVLSGMPLAAETRAYPTEELAPVGPGDLVVVHGTAVRTVPATHGRLALGRGTHNDVVIDRPTIGRDHLVVERRGAEWWIVPGDGRSGTLLDGSPLAAPARLDGQAVLELGRGVRVRLSVEPARAP